MRKLFISFVTAVLLASCSADSLMKETELDLTDTEKVYSDITCRLYTSETFPESCMVLT